MKPINLLVVLLIFFPNYSSAANSIKPNQALIDGDDGQTLISPGEIFELGFFGTGNSNNRYVGLWFKNLPEDRPVWVANRDNPLKDSSGVLTITSTGNVVIFSNQSRSISIWSSNSSAQNPTLQLLNNGNLVVKDGGSTKFVWQSFDDPYDTLIPGMKLGWNLETGQNWYLNSWNSAEDPSTGNCTYQVDPRGLPQIIQRRGSEILYRYGPWDDVRFGGAAPLGSNPILNETFVFNTSHVYYTYEVYETSTRTFFRVNPLGAMEQLRWSYEHRKWVTLSSLHKHECDSFGYCGPNGICNIGQRHFCRCPSGLEPKVARDWERLDWSSGCVSEIRLNCSIETGFKKLSNMKLPYSSKFLVERTVVQNEDCRDICSRNCSCVAYGLSRVSGCMLWFDDLLDMIQYNNKDWGQDLYIKMAASELGSDKDGKQTAVIVSVSVVSVSLLLFVVMGYIISMRVSNSHTSQVELEETRGRTDLQFFQYRTITAATDNYSPANKLGQGGFGTVYKGQLCNGQTIAVKRLSKNSGQGTKEFKTEVMLIAKLQHRNLVKLIGCCIKGEEKLLIYEFLSNRSLDSFIFDKKRRLVLDWTKRFNIITGVARGILYLHQDSRLRIIHRDLKTSNVLLDADMNPKISDFGLARIFDKDQIQDKTSRIVGTYGYMSPEYAVLGKFSIKSDVFSFGVVLLEIVSGKKNTEPFEEAHSVSMLGHVWKIFREDRALEIVDSSMESYNSEEVLRCIQVGLLCVQEEENDRPTMSDVVHMLSRETALPSPQPPPFLFRKENPDDVDQSSSGAKYSVNDVTISLIAR